MVEIIPHADASELIALAGACLELHESENNLPIGLALRTRQRSPVLRV